MRKVSLRNLAAHKVRLALTVLSVVLGTAFVAGSFVFTDTLQRTFDGIFEDVATGVDVRVSGQDDNGSGVPLADLDRLRAVPGVQAVQPGITGQIVLLGSDGKAVKGGGAPSLGLSYLPPDQQIGEQFRFKAGAPPARSGQIALNPGAARLGKLDIGSRTKVLVPSQGILDVTLTGIYETETETGGYIGALFTQAQALRLFTDGKHVGYVDVAGDGVSQGELRDRVAQALPQLKAKTGDEVRRDVKADISNALQFINYFLLAFGAIALLVGTFIIYNTFSMLVAQRLRELALLRAIGASRRQVSRSVLLEASLVGLVGSVLGIAGGVGLAYGLRALLNSFDVGLPSGPLQLQPRTVLIALAIGIGVTMFSAYSPARRAAKIAPVAAMREEFASTGTSLRRRTAIGAGAGLLGVLGLVAGAVAEPGGRAAGLIGLGALGLILGVLLGAPALSRPVIAVIGAGLGPVFGTVGRLARTNAVRNPRRTAATAFALTLGLMLVTTIAVFGASAKKSINGLVDNDVTADYILTGPDAIGVPVAAAPAVAKVSGVAATVRLHFAQVKIDGRTEYGTGVDGPLERVLRVRMLKGSADLSGRDLLVSQKWAEDNGWGVGSAVAMRTADQNTVTARIGGIYEDSQLLGNWLASGALYRELTPSRMVMDEVVLVKAAPGADLAAMRAGLERATDPLVVVQVQDREQFKGEGASQINALLAVLYGLLALAIVIAVLGIINTLALSVVERRREIGMLRAVGVLRPQLRRTIYLESMLIAVFGAIVGVALGLTFGSLFVHTLREQGLNHISVPVGQALLMLALAAVVGVLAALWPAARAARTPPLAAIADL
ncbi:ABC transporter permease [Jatrophihabitans sp.]|jgi:putative ABC transport system permease protein|uniref:ABC transporter permease n=1 Tax=Jatrophihabitans sp. TaxID=1932789 RepID=UPI0038CD4551